MLTGTTGRKRSEAVRTFCDTALFLCPLPLYRYLCGSVSVESALMARSSPN